MPANVETMFSVKETPWHRLGKVLSDSPTVEQGIIDAGLNWEGLTMPIHDNKGNPLPDLGKLVYRSDNNKILGVVGPRTHVLQNSEAFKWFQPFLDAKEATLETAGSLDEGRKVWVMAKIASANAEIVSGDEIAKFILLSNSHDGTTAVRVGFTPIRVVCANTLAMAHKAEESKLIRVRHSKDVKKNLENIREIMNVVNASFEATAEQYRRLTVRTINQADLRKYVMQVFGMETDESGLRPDSTRSKNILTEIERLFEEGKGASLNGVKGTIWGAYNAVTEYLNYQRGNSDDTRMDSLWFGDSGRKSQTALDMALAMAV